MRKPWNRGRRSADRPRRRGVRGRVRFWTHENIIQALRALARELGHSPSAREVRDSEDTPSEMLVRVRFGTFNAAIVAAGLTPRKVGGKVKHGNATRASKFRHKVPSIDPAKAAAITDAKRAFWQGAA